MAKRSECCKIDAIVTLDSKGQLVLPKDIREKASLKPGDKLAIIQCESEGETCCMILMKADALGDSVKTMLGPMLKDVFK